MICSHFTLVSIKVLALAVTLALSYYLFKMHIIIESFAFILERKWVVKICKLTPIVLPNLVGIAFQKCIWDAKCSFILINQPYNNFVSARGLDNLIFGGHFLPCGLVIYFLHAHFSASASLSELFSYLNKDIKCFISSLSYLIYYL